MGWPHSIPKTFSSAARKDLVWAPSGNTTRLKDYQELVVVGMRSHAGWDARSYQCDETGVLLKLTGETNKISSNTPPHPTPHTHAPHQKNTGLCQGNKDFQLPPWCHPTHSALTGFFLCKDFDSALHKHCSWAGLQKYRVIGKWNCVFVN